MRSNLLAFSIVASLGLAQVAHAAEGMWVPQQLPEIAGPLQKAGLKLSPEQLSNLTGDPMGAVVALGGASNDKPIIVVATNETARATGAAAGALVKLAAGILGGGGGGKPDLAQGGGQDASKVGEALAEVEHTVGRTVTN